MNDHLNGVISTAEQVRAAILGGDIDRRDANAIATQNNSIVNSLKHDLRERMFVADQQERQARAKRFQPKVAA